VESSCRFQQLADLEGNVTALMGADDEAFWQKEGLFTNVDSLGGVPPTLNPPACDLTTLHAHTINRSLVTTPSCALLPLL
jgi:hypothetical protein